MLFISVRLTRISSAKYWVSTSSKKCWNTQSLFMSSPFAEIGPESVTCINFKWGIATVLHFQLFSTFNVFAYNAKRLIMYGFLIWGNSSNPSQLKMQAEPCCPATQHKHPESCWSSSTKLKQGTGMAKKRVPRALMVHSQKLTCCHVHRCENHFCYCYDKKGADETIRRFSQLMSAWDNQISCSDWLQVCWMQHILNFWDIKICIG